MNWTEPFVVFRVAPSGELEEVYRAADFKSAKYWLTYIAKAGDVLCMTPKHPKHSHKSESPEYWGHKQEAGTATDEKAWREYAGGLNCAAAFPERPRE